MWGEVTSGFGEAVNSKLDELRVLEVNPALGVRPPMTTDDREQAALYPAEVTGLLACLSIPRARRALYAVAIYTGMRRSELARLEASDVDMGHGLITVRGKKTGAARRQVPIEPALAPLLEALVKARPEGPLLTVPSAHGKGGAADVTKRDLVRAGLDRAALFHDDAEHMPFTFHGLRHTAVTHWAVAGRPQAWLLVVAGHTDAAMTRRYLDTAAVVRDHFGEPHPPLPEALLQGADRKAQEAPKSPKKGPGTFTFPRNIATPPGIALRWTESTQWTESIRRQMTGGMARTQSSQ